MSYDLKYRPDSLSKVIGNKAVIRSIKTLLSTGEDAPHSWLLYGPSGIGKTTVARIIAKELGANDLGIIEKNGADSRKIDDIRELVPYLNSPNIVSKSLVVILDECHQLTKEAQNALLKSLEEPPSNVYFILCTTDPKKIINTIRTRVKLFEFSQLTHMEMLFLLKSIRLEEGLEISDEGIELIISASKGSARLGLNLLEKCQHISTNMKTLKKLLKSYDSEIVSSEAFEAARLIYQNLYPFLYSKSNLTVGALWISINRIVEKYVYGKSLNVAEIQQGLANLLGSFLKKKFNVKVADAVILLSKEIYTKAEFMATLCKVVAKIYK